MNKKEQTVHKSPGYRITENTPLTATELEFIRNYLKCGNAVDSVRQLGLNLSPKSFGSWADNVLAKPNVQKEIKRIMDELKSEVIADAGEVMRYFTSVMRGEVKDQFGLDAPLSERTKAAQELAKRTVDLENRKAGEPDQVVAIKLDWSRD